ncbi:MAG: hypothetical protein H6636_01620 [Anaerolineales bacterium]|nr:hypothetical protein [Anaerolineales bacterium]
METLQKPQDSPRVYLPAYGIWLISVALSVLSFIAGREMIIRTYTRFFPWEAWKFASGQGSLSLINILVSLPLATLMIVIIIGGFEYQHRYMGTREAWWLLARTLAVELGFLLLALYI